jgi:hypothetical protein
LGFDFGLGAGFDFGLGAGFDFGFSWSLGLA